MTYEQRYKQKARRMALGWGIILAIPYAAFGVTVAWTNHDPVATAAGFFGLWFCTVIIFTAFAMEN